MQTDLAVYGAFIDGDFWQAAGEVQPKFNPATGECAYQICQSSAAVCQAAVDSAWRALSIWAAYSAADKSSILARAALLLRNSNSELAALEVAETGKALGEIINQDILNGADCLEALANFIYPQLIGTDFLRSRQIALGVCAAQVASNSPLQSACELAGSALAAGNAIILQAPPTSCKSVLAVAQIFSRAGLPAGLVNVVHGGQLQQQFFIENQQVAKFINLDTAATAALVVCADSDLKQAASLALYANFYPQTGAFVNGARVFVEHKIYAKFCELLRQQAQDSIIIGDPLNPATNIGALLSDAHRQQAAACIANLKKSARNLVFADINLPAALAQGFYLQPHIFADCADNLPQAGALLQLLEFADDMEVVRRINSSASNLAAVIFSNDLYRADKICKALQTRSLWINGFANRNNYLNEFCTKQAINIGNQQLITPFS